MRKIIKKYFKPFLKKIHLYEKLFNFYFLILSVILKIKNFILRHTARTSSILLYHRIDNVYHDPIKLCVSPKTFEKHIVFLKNKYTILPLFELSERLYKKNISGNEIAITFDDGYKDNLLYSLPILEKHNVPATIFVTTSQIGKQAHHPWDLEYKEENKGFFLSEEELKYLSKNPLIEIGAHTHSHLRLSDLTRSEQREEIKKSKDILEKIIGNEIRLFAYPFGGKLDINKETIEIVREVGFAYAYVNNGQLSTAKDSRFAISRINIRECLPEELAKKI